MPDPTTLTAAFTSVKTALEIVKLIRESGTSLERAELNLRLADIVSALADAKMELARVQDTLAARDTRIAQLEEAFEIRGDVACVHDAIYMIGPGSGATGAPHCLRCWTVEHKLRPLSTSAANRHVKECHVCRATYNNMHAPTLSAEQPPRSSPPA